MDHYTLLHIDPDEVHMDDTQSVKKMKQACYYKHTESHSWLYFGRKTAPAMMDLKEVSELDKRALGNWATDVFSVQFKTTARSNDNYGQI